MPAGINFTGLASGVDTDAIVAAFMDVERLPQQRLQQRIDQSSARLAGLQDVRTKLGALRDASSSLGGVGTFTPGPWASSSDTARLTATAGPSAVKASHSVEVLGLARAEVRTQTTSLAAAAADDVLHLGAGSSFDVAVQAGDTIAAIAGKINAAGGDVAASVVEGKLRLSARETGTAHAVSLGSDGALAGALGVGVTLAAADARLRVDGVEHVRGSNTVDDVIAGTTLNLKAATGSAPVVVETDPAHLDEDGVVAKARTLANAYNAVVDTLRGALDERPVRDPQTAVDRRKGLFFGDTAYQGIQDRLRRAVTDPVSGAVVSYDQAAEIGLTGGPSTGAMRSDSLSGRVVLDEQKLRTALRNDPAAVEQLLTGPDGLASRLGALVGDVTSSNGALGGRIETENRRAADWKATSDRMGERLDAREHLLRAQFTAMERSLGQLQRLQSSLPSALGAAA